MQFTLHQGLYDAKCQECDRILNDNPWYAILSQYLKDMASIKEMLAKVIEAKCIKQAELNNLNKYAFIINPVAGKIKKLNAAPYSVEALKLLRLSGNRFN